ncbi:MAG: hypothetical protein M5U35_06495 [Roseovarius sp.]|nr:hypothetical protein [Roseovarius sp.]
MPATDIAAITGLRRPAAGGAATRLTRRQKAAIVVRFLLREGPMCRFPTCPSRCRRR